MQPEEQTFQEWRLALDRLRLTRARVRRNHSPSFWLAKPFVLYQLRQAERTFERALQSPVTVGGEAAQSGEESSGSAAQPQGTSEYRAMKAVAARSQAALQDGDTVTAARLASELLTRNTDRTSWNYGNIVHDANQLLGLAALQGGDTVTAGKYLLAAGQTPGSPQLDSFGPTMTLAQALLGHGEREVVINYLDCVSRFWASPPRTRNLLFSIFLRRTVSRENAKRIKAWKAAILRGDNPNLNRIV